MKKTSKNSHPSIVLVGPTAIGKTELSLKLAEQFNCEIIGVDSMQIYKYMDIGSAKPTTEELQRVPHHLIDYVDPSEEYSVSRFIYDAHEAVHTISINNKTPLFAGGTGLYFRGFFEGIFEMPECDPAIRENLLNEFSNKGGGVLYEELKECDPDSAARIHPNDKNRLLRALEVFRSCGKRWSELIAEHQQQVRNDSHSRIAPLKIGLHRDRQQLYDRIDLRVEMMVEQGLLNEVEKLLTMGYTSDLHSMQSLGYRHMLKYLSGDWKWEKSLELLARDTRRYAKRQLTWFNKDKDITWFSPTDETNISDKVTEYIMSCIQQDI